MRRKVGEKGWRERLERKVGDKDWRERLEIKIGVKGLRERFEKNILIYLSGNMKTKELNTQLKL